MIHIEVKAQYFLPVEIDHPVTGQTSLRPNQPTSLKVKNVHNIGIFKPIWLNFCMESLNGRTQHVNVIDMHLSMLNGQTSLSPNQPTSLKVKNVHKFDIWYDICL